jgi:pyruvate/2-oxoglutarate dehydrogenase complex dihydrolipoamide dehydrogenase (E3) component
LPKSLIILGGGPIGLEFAQAFRRFGAEVTIVELGPRILANEEAEISELVEGYLRAEGIALITSGRAVCAMKNDRGKRIVVRTADEDKVLEAEDILVATGRSAATGGLELDAAGVEHTQLGITIDGNLRTSQPHIWAAGDVGGGYMFTHVASYEGKLAAQNAFSKEPSAADLRVVPRITFVDPEVASVGLTEEEAIRSGRDVVAHRFSFSDLDRAILHNDARGIVKLVADAKSGEILGAHLVGPQGSSILAEVTLAMKHRLPISAIAETMHAYPSFPEAVEAAALDAPRCLAKVESDSQS